MKNVMKSIFIVGLAMADAGMVGLAFEALPAASGAKMFLICGAVLAVQPIAWGLICLTLEGRDERPL